MNQSIDFQSLKSGKAGGVAVHILRTGEDGNNHTNKNIDPLKTHLNVFSRESHFFEMKHMMDTLKIQGGIQKKTSQWTGIVIQCGNSEHHLGKKQAKKYYKKALEWVERTFGVSSITCSALHFDETTPHIHILLSNLTQENGKNYLSMNRKFGYVGMTPKEVKQRAKDISLDFFKNVSEGFGFSPESNAIIGRGKITIEDMKEREAVDIKLNETNKVISLNKKKIHLQSERLSRILNLKEERKEQIMIDLTETVTEQLEDSKQKEISKIREFYEEKINEYKKNLGSLMNENINLRNKQGEGQKVKQK